MISNQKQNQKPAITQPKPENQPGIILPPKADKPGFNHEDVQHLVEPIPQNISNPLEKPIINDIIYILGLTINDK